MELTNLRQYRVDCTQFCLNVLFLDCTLLGEPLGMKSGTIPNVALQASSSYPGYPPSSGRLDNEKGWIGLSNDSVSPYFQVNLPEKKTISRVCLQGINITSFPHGGAWIQELYFSYSMNGSNWTDYTTEDGRKVSLEENR